MFSFKDYLIEAKFSEDDLARILNVFQRRMPALLGSKIYRYGGDHHTEKAGGDNRITWLFGDKAFGVRYKGNHIHGIDVWTKFALNTAPSFFIDIHELGTTSIIASMKQIAKLIKSPTEGKFEATKSVNEGLQLDEMAKRVDNHGFYDMVVKKYGADKAKALSWDEIKAVADENDVLIPAYIRDNKIGRGKWNAEPGHAKPVDPTEEPKEDPKKATKKDPILYIKVTAQDPDTKKFLPAAEVKQAQALYQQIQGHMTDHKPSEKEMRDPETLYGHLSQLVGMACKGTLKSLLIYGGPGTGKTYTIMKTIKDQGLVAGKDYVKLSGKASPLSIYQTLFMFRDGGMVLFDDLDSMWGNQDATNILKAALDTSPVREISWGSSNTINVSKMDDDEKKKLFAEIDDKIQENPEKVKFPNQFDFTGRVVFISNLKKEEFDSAIMSRSAKINMDLSPEEILKRMRTILPKLGGEDVPMKDKEDLLDHLLAMHKRQEIEAVTMREFIKGLNILRSGVPNWRDLIQYA